MKNLTFHHIAIASSDIEKEYDALRILGYSKEGNSFIDEAQGIRGQFIIAEGQPRLELLENLDGYHTLDVWLNNNTKMYHIAYYAQDFDKSINEFMSNRAKIIAPAKLSVYFKSKICFLMLPDMFIIELIELPHPKTF